MARTRREWTDEELMAIMHSIIARAAQYPNANDKFLDALIDDVRAATGRIYGAGQYSWLLRNLAEQTQVTRRPSTTTVNQAVARAHALKRAELSSNEGGISINAHEIARILDPVLRELIGPVLAVNSGAMHNGAQSAGTPAAVSRDDALRLRATEASLVEALNRLRSQDEEVGRLQREVGRVTARAEAAEGICREMLAGIHQAIVTSAVGAEQVADVVMRLNGTEVYLMLQNDAVRRQTTAEVDGLRAENAALKKEKDHLILQCDQMRRARLFAGSSRGGATVAIE